MASLTGLSAENQKVESITQYGITWRFDKPVEAGQFVTGDWWAIGPLTIVSVEPKPGPVETESEAVVKSRYGAEATKADDRMRNGSMIPLLSSSHQSYDSRLKNYFPEESVNFPVELAPNTSIVSTESNAMMKVDCLVHKIMWSSEKKGNLVLKSAAVLTVLGQKPPVDAFRPPYAGSHKPIFTFSQVDTSKLLNLEPPKEMPKWEDFEHYLERPWLDHMATWLHQMLGPSENQVNYGREFARVNGMAGLMLNTKAPLEQKKKLLIGLIQLGIDLRGVIASGRQYAADGGHYSGRKFPILFAGAMLNDPEMLNPTALSNFAEDLQTYYGKGWAGQKALYQIVYHTGPKPPHEHKTPDTWDENNKRAEGYRGVNGVAWPATALTVRLMGLVKEWNHDVFFDYNDRWMSAEDPYAENYKNIAGGKFKRNKGEGKTYDRFTDAMWKMYRGDAVEPNWSRDNRMWVNSGKSGEWVKEEKPAEPAESWKAQ